jgi:kanamycin kinase/aminoglycoside 3'-phosphotransferase-3
MSIPASIASWIQNKTGQADNVGLSGSSVTVYDEFVLKIEPLRPETLTGIETMQWLQEKAPVPQILCQEIQGNTHYLLMSRMPGKMACDPEYLQQPEMLVQALADSLRFLWSVNTDGCPRNRTLNALLEEARYNVDHNLVDMENVDPDTFTRFRDPAHLLDWLTQNKVESEPVLSHGDHCLPNVFLENGKFQGYIDIGDMGIGEKWRDIALCWRSLRDNFQGKYGGKQYAYDPDSLFDALGITPDWEKIRYHLLLDELF